VHSLYRRHGLRLSITRFLDEALRGCVLYIFSWFGALGASFGEPRYATPGVPRMCISEHKPCTFLASCNLPRSALLIWFDPCVVGQSPQTARIEIVSNNFDLIWCGQFHRHMCAPALASCHLVACFCLAVGSFGVCRDHSQY
jgi:hypothetical protein